MRMSLARYAGALFASLLSSINLLLSQQYNDLHSWPAMVNFEAIDINYISLFGYFLVNGSKIVGRVLILNHTKPSTRWLLESEQGLQLGAHLQHLASRVA